MEKKKGNSFWNIPKAKELNAKIAKPTEDIEQLKSEKAVLLNELDCVNDVGIATIKKDIASAEAGLSKLEQQEEKYASEPEAALREYADLKEQGADFKPAQLYAQRMRSVWRSLPPHPIVFSPLMGEKYDPLLMFDSQRAVAELLHENAENRAFRREVEQQKQQGHENTQKEKYKCYEQEQ